MRLRTLFAAITLALSMQIAAPTAALAESLPTEEDAGARISVTVEGQGPDVILIPGLASSREVWSGLAAEIGRHHRVHLVQLAGFAGSPPSADPASGVVAPAAEALADYIAGAELDHPTIVGHSLGGAMALMIGARHPGLAGRLLVVDALPFYALTFSPAATVEAMKGQAAALRDGVLAAPKDQYEAMQSASIARMSKTEAARPALVAAGLASDRATVAAATYELMTTDLRGELGRIAAPLEVVYAYDTSYGVPAERIDALFAGAYEAAPAARLLRVDGSYHFVMLDQPGRFAAALEAFLDAPGIE